MLNYTLLKEHVVWKFVKNMSMMKTTNVITIIIVVLSAMIVNFIFQFEFNIHMKIYLCF